MHALTSRIAVVGPGAVGGLIAALLRRDGSDVVVVAREASARRIEAEGIRIESGLHGDWVSDVPVSTEIPTGALVVLATKAYAIDDVAAAIAASRPVLVLSLLNGLDHVDALRAVAPGVPVSGAAIAVEAQRRSASEIEHRSPFTRLTVASDVAGSPLVAALEHAGVEVVVGGSEAEVLWTKLRFLAPFALLTSRTQTGIGDALTADPELATRLLDEIALVATAQGLPTTGSGLSGILESMPASMRSSLQADLAAGGAHELDAIGGAVVRAATARGIPTPTLESLIRELDPEGVASRTGRAE